MLIEKSVREYLRDLASADPVPGGGSASAAAGALAASLFSMVIALTVRKEGEKAEALRPVQVQMLGLAEACTRMVDRDADAYSRVRDAWQMPKEPHDAAVERGLKIQLAMREAATVPLEQAEACLQALEASSDVLRLGRASCISDAGVGNFLALSAIMGAALNVETNLQQIEDPEFLRLASERLAHVQQRSQEVFERNQQIILDRMTANT
jgi:formiminotetrahydrofolate cyclodeaminase